MKKNFYDIFQHIKKNNELIGIKNSIKIKTTDISIFICLESVYDYSHKILFLVL